MVSTDLDGVIQTWNPSAERMFGYRAAEAIGRSIRIIIPEDRQQEEEHVLGEIRAGRPVRHFETLRRRKDGSLIPISLTVSPLRDAAGVIIGASKIARDISDRAQADLATRRLAAVVESSDDAIVTKDLNSIITSWNKGAQSLFGYTAKEAIGQSIRMLIPADLQSEEDMVLASIRAGRAVEHYETRRLRKDGSEVTISLTVSPLVDAQGTVVGASKIARDISDRVRLDEMARKEASITQQLNDIGRVVAGSLDRNAIVQQVTDVATGLTEAEFGAVGGPERGLCAVPSSTRDCHFRPDVPRRGETCSAASSSATPDRRSSRTITSGLPRAPRCGRPWRCRTRTCTRPRARPTG